MKVRDIFQLLFCAVGSDIIARNYFVPPPPFDDASTYHAKERVLEDDLVYPASFYMKIGRKKSRRGVSKISDIHGLLRMILVADKCTPDA